MKCVSLSLSAFLLMGGLCFAQEHPVQLGVSNGKLNECPGSPNCVSSQTVDPQHSIAPLIYRDDRAEAFARLLRILTAMKRTDIITEKDDYIHAEVRSFLFRFVDDIEFYFPPRDKLIHVRSASRVGSYDLGVNRRRVEEIRESFSQP